MGLNKHVDFSTAKLLKEKGFEEISSNFYTNPRCKMFGIDEHGRYYPIKNKAKSLWISGNAATLDSKHVYYAPTIGDVIMWLYEKHGIWIENHITNYGFFYCQIWQKSNDLDKKIKEYQINSNKEYNSPTEAYEAAIKYCMEIQKIKEAAIDYTLNNLI